VPTYEYQCNDCSRIFEVRQRISEAPLTRCDTCGGTLKRLLSAAPFILKGEGWYVTDYPSDARKKALQSEKSGGDGTSKSDGASKSDSTSKSDGASKSDSTSKTDGKKEGSAAPAAEKSAASRSTTASTNAVGPTPAKTSSSD
jgi:putative FmdB family regulatory protein